MPVHCILEITSERTHRNTLILKILASKCALAYYTCMRIIYVRNSLHFQLLEIHVKGRQVTWESMESFWADEFTVVNMTGDGMCGWASVLHNMGRIKLVHVDGSCKWSDEDWTSLLEFASEANRLLEEEVVGNTLTERVRR